MTRRTMRRLAGLLLILPVLSCSDTTGPGPAQILLAPSHPVVGQGDTLRLSATVVDANGATLSGDHPSFFSADPTVATVDANGLVTSVGRADTVRISAAYGKIGSFVDLVVTPKAASIQVAPDSVMLNVRGRAQLIVGLVDFVGQPVLTPTLISYASSDTSIAKVNTGGVVYSTSQNTGSATITVTADSFVVQVKAIVAHLPATIETSPLVVVLAPGGSRQITTVVKDSIGNVIPSPTVSFRSGDSTLFSVTATGLVTSVGSHGTGTLQLSSSNTVALVPVIVGTPPPGTLVNRVAVPGPAYGSALSAAGKMFITLPTTAFGMRGNLSALAFSDTVATLNDPLGVSLNPDGTRAYVAERSGSDVAVVDLANNSVTHSGTIGNSGVIYTTVVSPDGQYLFVGTSGWVFRLNSSTLGVIDSVAANTAMNLAVHPTLNRLYVSNYGNGTVSEVDWTTMTVTRTFGSGGSSQGMSISPDGGTLYVAYEDFAGAMGGVVPYDLGNGAPGTIFYVPGAAGVAVHGDILYVSAPLSGYVYGFNRITGGSPLFTLVVLGVPRRLSIGSDGILIVPNEGGWSTSGWVDFIQ